MDEVQGHVGVGPGLGPSRLGQRGGDFGPKIQAGLGLNVSFPRLSLTEDDIEV